MQFQEALLGQTVVFTAGIAEAKSKGRGEECISQNLRILLARNGRQIIIFFANSQRKEKKRYVSIPRKQQPRSTPDDEIIDKPANMFGS